MVQKYTLPNFKDHLVSQGMTLSAFHREAYKTVEADNVSNRLWSAALNRAGAGETSVNKMVEVAQKTFARLEKPCPDEALVKAPVAEKADSNAG